MYISALKDKEIPKDFKVHNRHVIVVLHIDEKNIAHFIGQWQRLGSPQNNWDISLSADTNSMGYKISAYRKMPDNMAMPDEDFVQETYRLGYELVRKLSYDAEYLVKLLEATFLAEYPSDCYLWEVLKERMVKPVITNMEKIKPDVKKGRPRRK